MSADRSGPPGLPGGTPGREHPGPPGLLEALDPEQRLVAEALHGPVCVLAGAGTGKTRAITHRIAHGVRTGEYEPERVLAVTFTTRAAGEMRGRLATLGAPGVQARTFHSAALRQARWFFPDFVGQDLPPIVERNRGLVTQAARRVRVAADERDLVAEIAWAKVNNADPERYPDVAARHARVVAGADHDAVARVYDAYEQVKSEQGVIDLSDVLLAAVGLLSEHPSVAARVRAQYRWFVVDEYQDVSPVQETLLSLWLGDRDDVCVVGDPAQTIYSFAGASSRSLLDFTRRYPDATTVRLTRNYRSSPQILHVANAVLAKASGPERAGAVLQAQQPDGSAVELLEAADEPAEAVAAASVVGSMLADGIDPRSVAVLLRTNAQTEPFEEAFAEAGIPVTLRGAERFFERGEVRQALGVLRAAAMVQERSDPDETAPPEEQRDAAAMLVDDVRAVLRDAGWQAEAPEGRGAARQRWESLAALVALAEDAARTSPMGLPAFVESLRDRAAMQHAPDVPAVTIATLHAAKGLEWDAVVLSGAHDGGLPWISATSPADVEEERRLCYVGLTRARHRLYVSWSRSRSPGGAGKRRLSRFLVGVLGADDASTRTLGRAHPPAAGERAGRARRRSPVALPTGEADQALLEALKQWRLARSRSDAVPAYVVFTDATLTGIAISRPRTAEELAVLAGVGPVKLERYGPDVLQVCAAHGGASDG